MRFSNIQIVIVFTVLGTIIRWIYGIYFTIWHQAPDHMAWELILREGAWNYAQLIHYPHEGGSILVSLISRCIGQFSDYNSLAISALILDSTSRFIQLWIISKVFSNKILWAFGTWTLFATPMILKWSMVNFGLHHISSVFPFLFIYFIYALPHSKKSQWIFGTFLGLSVWFSYINLVLIPVYLIYYFLTTKKYFPFRAILGLTIVLGTHLFTRVISDSGFHLSNYSLTSIRGVEFLTFSFDHIQQLGGTWIKVVPQFAIGNTTSHFALTPLAFLWFILFFVSLWGIYISYKKDLYSKSIYWAFLTIPIFLVLYGLSPFYYGNIQNGNFITYRHLTYIFPLLSVMIIVGLSKLKYQKTFIAIYLFIPLISLGTSIDSYQNTIPSESSIKATGWVIGYKFGHDPSKVQNIISNSRDYALLLEGSAWGVCTALFEKPANSREELSNRIDQLLDIKNQFKPSEQIIFLQGVKYAFSPEVYPQLPPETLMKILELSGS